MTIWSNFCPFLFGVLYSFFTITQAYNFGFSTELIHRDSPNSPLYKPFEFPSQRIANAFHHSINRAKHFYPTASFSSHTPEADIIPNGNTYLMNITIGTPPVSIVAVVDTGSDLIWTQCKPCVECFKQRAPIFDPSTSSTYKDIPCASKLCKISEGECRDNTCIYEYIYGDSSYSGGNISLETITLPSSSKNSIVFPKTIFGCGHSNGGTFNAKTSGIIGLGRGQISLINQMGPLGGKKFSYCLAPLSSKVNSKINFGANAIVSGEGAVSTTIINKHSDTSYFLTLEGMSVGDEKFELAKRESSHPIGNIIIDSGTTFTMLPKEIYHQVESAMKKQIKQQPTKDPSGNFKLCYKGQGDNFEAPIITAHFTGADVKLNLINTFVYTEGLMCLALIPMYVPIQGIGGFFGNMAQINFLVGYDLEKNIVTFKPANCARKT